LSSIAYLEHLLVTEGPLTRRPPDGDQKKDIAFGFQTAKAVAGLDLGQTVCVKNQAVLAVEAMEGTDACIRRAGTLCDGSFTVVKVAKPRQDLRFDVPVIGAGTLQALQEANAAVLAVEAGKTLFFDKAHFLTEADKTGLVLVGTKC
ncbi:MAG TPA: LpxI family protein, partial [Elusimicrobiota bacterium]|nr:LpxI family protein [Elusimicrobiota bacterium]